MGIKLKCLSTGGRNNTDSKYAKLIKIETNKLK
jgi:hypothetical protein